jgi:hypothetical protein
VILIGRVIIRPNPILGADFDNYLKSPQICRVPYIYTSFGPDTILLKTSTNSDAVLVATLHRDDGGLEISTLSLEQLLGNDNGHFRWGGSDFRKTARNIRLIDKGTKLEADLQVETSGGEKYWLTSSIDLTSRIYNMNGTLVAAMPSILSAPESECAKIAERLGKFLLANPGHTFIKLPRQECGRRGYLGLQFLGIRARLGL